MDYINKIKELLRVKGLTYKDLAQQTGISPTTILNIMNARSKLTVDNMKRIAEVLGVSISYFFDEGGSGIQVANNGVVSSSNVEIKQVIAHSHELEREVAELRARLEGCEKLLKEKDKQIEEKERQIALLEQMIEMLKR